MKKCSKCGSSNSNVTETRIKPDGSIQRRRSCLDCGFKWITVEVYKYQYEQLKDYLEEQRLDKLTPPKFRGYETR